MDNSLRLGEKPAAEMTDRELAEATLAEVMGLMEILHKEPAVSNVVFLRLGILWAGVCEIKRRSDERE